MAITYYSSDDLKENIAYLHECLDSQALDRTCWKDYLVLFLVGVCITLAITVAILFYIITKT